MKKEKGTPCIKDINIMVELEVNNNKSVMYRDLARSETKIN
jgi:hypothetical protein